MVIITQMKLSKDAWYLILLVLVIITLIVTNELGIGVLTFVPLMLLAYWLMVKVFENEKPGD